MRILFWIGYSNPHWDKGTWENKGIGGSEYCVLKLADYFDLKGHDVTITGDVKNGDWYGVKYTHHTQLKQNEHYDVVIAISYLHYLKHLAELNITFDKNFFWMHNEFFSISARCSTGLFRVEVNRSAVPTVRRASRSTCDNSAQTHYSRPEVLWLPSHPIGKRH